MPLEFEQRLRGRGLLLDTNVLILYCVGLLGERFIGRHKKLNRYDAVDFTLLASLVGQSSSLHAPPNVLTETANLAVYGEDASRANLAQAVKRVINDVDETYIPSKDAISLGTFVRLGLTDAVLLTMLQKNPRLVLLTDDQDLYLAASYGGFSAVNFSHVRDQRPDFR